MLGKVPIFLTGSLALQSGYVCNIHSWNLHATVTCDGITHTHAEIGPFQIFFVVTMQVLSSRLCVPVVAWCTVD